MECMRDNFYNGVVLDGRYQTIAPLNHGSFGMVFQALDLTTKEIVAIKCLTKNLPVNEISSFAVDEKSEELACHARLGSHSNIVNLIHSFETEAHIYLVLEYCPKGDLYEAIRTRSGPWQTESVRVLMLQLVDAVAYIHSKGMYHRDLKPENIFLTASNNLKVGDFGLATTEEWSYETTVGSDRYMSPEQYDSAGAGYSPAQADIWAIGICLLNVLFARNPFTTPTESDNLFLDFSKDRQSLFDVFPTMSLDTFEIISHCMSLDPKKRSLSATREALVRAVSFTTEDETLDDYIDVGRPTIASAHREPLRTPSIQSPQVDQGAFPWAKHLHASPPQPIRQLSIIQDTESYTEDLFPSSESSNKDWFSVNGQTPSMSSVMESSLTASLSSLVLRRQAKKSSPLHADLTPISGSLPIAMNKPKLVPSMSTVFGRKSDMVSKSWSEMYDEDTEDEDDVIQLKERQAQNARTYSHESNADDVTVRREGLSGSTNSVVNLKSLGHQGDQARGNDVDSDTVNDGFFFHDTRETRHYSPPRYSPPAKRVTVDKWAALGDRRRAYTGESKAEKSPIAWRGRRNTGNTSSNGVGGYGQGVWDFKDKAYNNNNNNNRTKVCPWVKDRDHFNHQSHRRDRVSDLGDLEWVGGWQESPDLQL